MYFDSQFTLFSFNTIEELIKHYSEEESQLPVKLTYAPMKEYYQNKEKDGYTEFPEYHHSKRYYNEEAILRANEFEDEGFTVVEPRHPKSGIANPGENTELILKISNEGYTGSLSSLITSTTEENEGANETVMEFFERLCPIYTPDTLHMTSARQTELLENAKKNNENNNKCFIARNEVEAIRVRPGEGMTSVIYQVRPQQNDENTSRVTSSSATENVSALPEAEYNPVHEPDPDSISTATMETTVSETVSN